MRIADVKYPLEVVASEVDADKILHLKYQVVSGPHEGVVIDDTTDLKTNDGVRKLSVLCRAVGLRTIEDSEELHFRPFDGVVRDGKVARMEPIALAA